MTATLVVIAVVVAVAAIGGAWVARSRAVRQRAAEDVARELIPEIRTLVDTDGGPAASGERFRTHQEEVRRLLSNEQAYAVENFYGCVEAYRRAQATMTEAFSEEDERSLGDRIRAKDQRDRLLKDLFYTGEAAIEQLENALGE